MEPIKIAIVGIGHIAEHQINALRNLDSYKIVGICDLREEKRVSVPPHIPFFTDYKEMLSMVEIDTVLVSTPNVTHYEISKFVLTKGIDVLVEKPAVHKLELLEELVHLTFDNGVSFTVAYHAHFGNDVIWFREQLPHFKEKYGPITGYQCQFYDPYIQEGKLLTNAKNLQGSWIDSGVNALSVIRNFIPLQDMEMVEARLSKVAGFDCNEIQGTVDFSFSINNGKELGRGQIDTNWTIGRNHKQTTLYFDRTNQTIILQHSLEQVLHVKDNKQHVLVKNFSNSRPRLENHYINLFRDYYQRMKDKEDRQEDTITLHRMLFSPYH